MKLECSKENIFLIAMTNNVTISTSLFRNKGFLVNLKTKINASKFAMFMEKENPCSVGRKNIICRKYLPTNLT